MPLFKISFDSTNPSFWIKLAAVLMGIAALVAALPELPNAIDAVQSAYVKVQGMMAGPTPAPSSQPQAQPLPTPSPVVNAPVKPVGGPLIPAHGKGLLDDPAPVKPPVKIRGLLDDDPSAGAPATPPGRP